MKFRSDLAYATLLRSRKVVAFVPLNPIATDQKTVAERQWLKPALAPKPQKPCDHGLFSDDAKQIDLLDLTRGNSR